MTPLVSVYITNHNYGQYIRQAIESILNQTMQDFELIIIDDGSTDNSHEIIEGYEPHRKIRVIYQRNKGLNITNNIASRVARGKYLMRLDADDYVDENALMLMSNKLESDKQLGLVFPDYYLVDADNNVLALERRHNFEKDVSMLDQPAHGACTMVRRQFLLDVGGYDEDFSCQDGYDLWLKFSSRYPVANVNLPLFYYRQHGKNLTRNENRLLNTRMEMKRVFSEPNLPILPTVAILPVRGSVTNPSSFALEELSDKLVIDWLIGAAVQSEKINMLVVTSPDEAIGEHVSARYGENERVVFMQRTYEQARLNQGLVETVEQVLAHPAVEAITPEAIMRLSIEYPFITSKLIDDAVRSLTIFQADTIIGVRPETNLFFQHDGNGMQPILGQEKFTRLERESLYRNVGGLSLTKKQLFDEQKKFQAGRVSHVIVNQRAAHSIRSVYDMRVAQFLASQPDL